ncbi:DUF177 domain-containing protein, partial [Candidatus Fermentibacterales bacterium]|nr:DUF177 domain-containing protein [Candidatus Fermentibacterales bacterium]
ELLLRGEVLVCRGLLEGSVVLRCARCLDHYGARVSESFTRSFTWGPRADEDDYETQSVLSRCSTVSILDGVREAIILSVPRMPLCSPDCRGLCPACGANLNRESCAHSKNGGSAAARN